ncbi:pleckstrin homology domain-containing family A member 6 isoform X3 [Hypomesus transpacificus]|uniref:pleckstrin homology domain-containing family A member 6 isoform X3 n=1 Tax=Hypomesus transpacificus TaxID=137520 RepID=UPI001F07C02E|nr:pleckstrin homology domain-containing family A member 6 isoform X3 [Hypomesus transpacificus]
MCQNDQSRPAGSSVIQLQLEDSAHIQTYLQSCDLDMNGRAGGRRPIISNASDVNCNFNRNMVSDQSPESQPYTRASRTHRKAATFGKRSNSMRRNPKAEVSKQGWLYKQAGSGVKQWNKRWFVLTDRCLFYYKDEKEDVVLGSLPLLSFQIGVLQPSDNIGRKHAFKAEHAGTRTYYFSAECQEEQEQWVAAMSEATWVQPQPTQRMNSETAPTAELSHTMGTRGPDTHSQHPDTHSHTSKEDNLHTPTHPQINGIDDMETPPPSTPHFEQDICGEKDKVGDRGRGGPSSGSCPPPLPHHQGNGWSNYRALTDPHHANAPLPGSHGNVCSPQCPAEGGGGLRVGEQPENVVLRRGFVPRTAPERMAQRKSSMTQLQQWVNQRRGLAAHEDMNSPARYYTVNRGVPSDCYGVYGGVPPYVEEYPLYPPGVRPDSICSVSAVSYDHLPPRWAEAEKQRSLRDGPALYGLAPQSPWAQPGYYRGPMDAAQNSLRRLSIQPRSRSVPRSPSSSSGGPYSPGPHSFVSPARSSSARLDQLPSRMREEGIYADPSVYGLRRSLSSPKYDYPGDRMSLSQGPYHCNYPASPSLHSKMEDILDLQLQRKLEYLDQQVPPFHDVYRDLHPMLKFNEIETSKLLGRLCEQNRLLKDQEAVVHRLRMDKDCLEGALVATHQEMETYPAQPLAREKLLLKKESLQNQLINIRGELSQASSAMTTARMEFEAMEDEANAIHGDLWEQLNAGGQSELVHRHIQKEFWRVQDVLEGLHKTNLSRGTDTAKHRVASGVSGSFSTSSPASPLSSISLTSPLSPFSPVPGCQASPSKQLEHKFGHRQDQLPEEWTSSSDVHEVDQDRQSSINKVGIVPPRTKSPVEVDVSRRNGRVPNGISRERPKSAVFPAEVKSKMTVEEQNERIRRNQSSSVRDKRRSLNLSGGQSTSSYRVVRRRLTAHEVDIKDLEAAVRGEGVESPREEIARLRRSQIEPDHYNLDINNELLAPDKVLIPERYLDVEEDAPLSPEEQREKQKKVERIKTLIAKSNLQNVVPLLDGPAEGRSQSHPEQQLQEQEKRIEISCALAAEASRRSRLLSAQCAPSPPTSPTNLAPLPSSADFSDSSHIMKV